MQEQARADGGTVIEPAPVPGAERLAGLDVLRGVAVLGILVMNIYAFAMPFAAYTNPLLMGGLEPYNLGTWFVTHVFFDQKFMSIFSMLFGAGIVLMMQRMESRGARFGPIFFRRQFWLLVIGLVHAYLVWMGDILFFYAVVGMLAFLFRKRSPRTLLIIGVLALAVGQLMGFGASHAMNDLRSQAAVIEAGQGSGEAIDTEAEEILEQWQATREMVLPGPDELANDLAAYRGSYADSVAFRSPHLLMMQLQALPFFIVWRVGGLMLIGMALMKLGILAGTRDATLYGRMAVAGYVLGLPLTVFSGWNAWQHGFDAIYMFGPGGWPNYVGSVIVALGHTGLVLWLVRSGRCHAALARFGAVGRMALTNYLAHSIVLTAVFYGYGLGLYGHIPRLAQMAFVAAVIGVQLAFSPWWLARYRFGPAEWLWRSLTYWRRQPMRRAA